MAKSTRQKKKDKAKVAAKRAEAQRLRARAERQREEDERLAQLLRPETEPAEVAALLEASEMTELVSAATVARMRAEHDVPPAELAETARILLSATGEPSEGALAFAAIAAHANGDEDAEQRHADELLARLDPADGGAREIFARSVALVGHPGRAAEIVESWLRDHPGDKKAGIVYAEALQRANNQEDPGPAEHDALDRFADESGLAAVREAVSAFLERTEWGAKVTAAASHALEEELDDDRRVSDTECGELSALVNEIAIWGTQAGDHNHDHDHEHEEHEHVTALTEFAADPGTPPELVKRASDWTGYAHYGLWLLEMPPDPGVWGTELVTGTRRYIQFPDGALADGAPRTVWLGGVWPVDGVWRSTGTGVRLSPDEGDAVAEFAVHGLQAMMLRLMGVHKSEIPLPEPIPFGEPDPRGVRLLLEDDEADELTAEGYDKVASTVVSVLAPELAVETYLHRATSPPRHSTAGGEKSWLDRPVTRLDGLTPREASEGDLEDLIYLEAELRQLEYQAGLAAAAGKKPLDAGWIRAQLGMDGELFLD